MYCRFCGQNLLEEDKYCFRCERKVSVVYPDSRRDSPERELPNTIRVKNANVPPIFYPDELLDVLGLPTRVENALKNWNIGSVRQFYEYPEQNIINIRNIGLKTAKYLLEVKKKIRKRLETEEKEQKINMSVGTQDSRTSTYDRKFLISSLNLGLPRRLVNLLNRKGITSIQQFYKCKRKRIRKIKGVGPKSLLLIWRTKRKIEAIIKSKQKFDQTVMLTVKEVGMVETAFLKKGDVIAKKKLINLLMSRCDDNRAREIIIRRYGLMNGEKETLEEIGKHYEITRERVRQIQVKTMKRMKHSTTKAKKPIIELADNLLFKNGGIISDKEARILIPQTFENNKIEGSSLLDLLNNLGWIQRLNIDDVILYSPNIRGICLEKIAEKIINVVSAEVDASSISEIVEKIDVFKKITDERLIPVDFVARYCHLDPRIEEVGQGFSYSDSYAEHLKVSLLFRHYKSGHKTKVWASMIRSAFKIEKSPLHFTEVANKVNDLIPRSERKLSIRRAHSILIASQIFAHTGVRGTYGLVEWGIRKKQPQS